MQLLQKKNISSITVKEICEVADINRSTFYAHYDDPYDLLYKIEDEVLDDMNETLSSYNYDKEEEALLMTQKILEYVARNQEVCRTLLSEHGGRRFMSKIMDVTYTYTMKKWVETKNMDPKTSEYLSVYVISGSLHIIKKWLDNHMDTSPKELAEMMIQFTNKGLHSFD